MNELLLRRRAMMSANRPTTTLKFSIPADTKKEVRFLSKGANGWKTKYVDWGDGTCNILPAYSYMEHTYATASTAREIVVKIVGLLSELHCTYMGITSLDVTEQPELTYLRCHDNNLTTLDVSRCPALYSLNCGSNQLTALDVSKNTALTTLSCYSNQLTALDVSKCPKISTLLCYNNKTFTEKIGGIDGFTRAIKQYQLWKSVGDYDLTGFTFDTTTGDLALETDGVVKVNASINRKQKYSKDWLNNGINSWSIKAEQVEVHFEDGTVTSDKAAYYEKIAQIVKDENLYEYPQLCKIHTPTFGLQETRDNYATHKVLLCDSGNNSLWQNGRVTFGAETPTNHIDWKPSKSIHKNYVTTPLIKCRIVVSPNASFYITVVSSRYSAYDNRQRVICTNGELQAINSATIVSETTDSTTNQTEYIVQFDIFAPVNNQYFYGHTYCLFEDKYPDAEDPYETRVSAFEEVKD